MPDDTITKHLDKRIHCAKLSNAMNWIIKFSDLRSILIRGQHLTGI